MFLKNNQFLSQKIIIQNKMREENNISAPEPVNIAGTEKILHQMKNCVCKIKIGKINATGFFCKVPFINMIFLMTNFHVVSE